MSNPPTSVLAWSTGFLVVLAGPGSSDSADPPSSRRDLPAIAGRAHDIIDAVRKHHIDPPGRHEMILAGMAAMFKAVGVPVPDGLDGRVSSLTTREQLATLLAEVWPAPLEAGERESDAFLEGLLAGVPGHPQLFSTKQLKVTEQIQGNRYVGIHVALATSQEEGRPQIAKVIEGGPAERAGVKDKDLIEEIDGLATKGRHCQVGRPSPRRGGDRRDDPGPPTRGQGGTDAADDPGDVAQEDDHGPPRAPRQGVGPHRQWHRPDRLPENQRDHGQHAPRAAADGPTARGGGARALVLDLRSIRVAEFHPTVLLADSLLDGGMIGRVRMPIG
ncbi:MAG: hypothetical protein WKF75_16800 [Singulisphaera sp.]